MKLKRVRGGTRFSYARYARCAYRLRIDPGHRNFGVGFRYCFSPFFVKINKEG